MTHQIDVLSAKKCSCLSRCVRARIVVVKSDPSSASWKTTGKQMPNHSELTVLRCSSATITTCQVFPKKTGDHLLESASCAGNFCLGLAHFETPIQSTAVYFRAHRRVSKHRVRIFALITLVTVHDSKKMYGISCILPH